jgi:hypothetical protein
MKNNKLLRLPQHPPEQISAICQGFFGKKQCGKRPIEQYGNEDWFERLNTPVVRKTPGVFNLSSQPD